MCEPAERVRLEPLEPGRFEDWARRSREGFVEQQVASGTGGAAEAEAYAAAEQAALLPLGLRTPGQHIWSVLEGDDPVGHLWVGVGERPDGREAFVYDLALEPRARGRGLGRATMLAAETRVRAMGAVRVRLNVFGHNVAALRLYAGLGYRPVATMLTKRLDAPAPTGYDGPPHVVLAATSAEGWTVHDGGRQVGAFGLRVTEEPDGRHALCHHLAVPADLLGGGHHRAVLASVERVARDRGAVLLRLHVREPEAGTGADALHARLGFAVTARLLVKELAPVRVRGNGGPGR